MKKPPRRSPLGPPPRTSFVGREEELRALGARFRAGDRLVTVLGPPGAGKTRLAERFASRVWKGDVVGCGLAGARDGADIARALGGALDVPLAGETSAAAVDRLGFALAERGRCLVVLDNFEQLVGHAAATVGRWLDLAPEALWLCTSRQRLALAGESCLALGGLSPEQADRLFAERARLVTGDAAAPARNAERARLVTGDAAAPARNAERGGDESDALGALLERLDRLPLAIELAASRAGVLSPRQLLGALSRRFELLDVRRADGEPRHASMRAAIDVSWELLPVEEQRALARISAFPAPFSLAAADVVLAGGGPALGLLERLCGRSLLRAVPPESDGDETRFALYESVREYAAERLAGSEDQLAAEHAHACFYVAEGARLAAELSGPRPAGAVRGLTRDLDHLLAAHRRLAATAPELAIEAALAASALLVLNGSFETERALLDSAVELAALLGPTTLAARAWFARGKMCGMRGMHADARRDFARSREAARAAGDRAAEARAVYGLSASFREMGDDLPAAYALAEEGLGMARAAGDTEAEAWCLGALGAAAAAAGRLDEAVTWQERAIALLARRGHLRALALNRCNLALTREMQGLVEEAQVEHMAALRLAKEAGDDLLAGRTVWGLTRLLFDAGRTAEAEAELDRLEASARRMGDREVTALVLVERARQAVLGGDREAGLAWVGRARDVAATIDSSQTVREIEAVQGLAGTALPALRVDANGYWFERPGLGRVDLSRRRSLRLVFASLLEARAARAAARSVEELLAAGWPGESVHPESGSMRVWTAVRTLRRLGLSGVLVLRDGGYALDPAVALEPG